MKRQFAFFFILFNLTFTLTISNALALPPQPELASFFRSWTGSWSGAGTIKSATPQGESSYTLDFDIAQISEKSFERSSRWSMENGQSQQSITAFELSGSAFKLAREGEGFQDVIILDATPTTLWFATHAAGDGRIYDLVYRLQIAGDRLLGHVDTDYQGEKISENRFVLTRSDN